MPWECQSHTVRPSKSSRWKEYLISPGSQFSIPRPNPRTSSRKSAKENPPYPAVRQIKAERPQQAAHDRDRSRLPPRPETQAPARSKQSNTSPSPNLSDHLYSSLGHLLRAGTLLAMLNTLPLELLHLIFADIITSEPAETNPLRGPRRKERLLWSLSVTNRYLNYATNVVLYSRIELRDMESCQLLLRTLHEKSALGAYCTFLHLHHDVRVFVMPSTSTRPPAVDYRLPQRFRNSLPFTGAPSIAPPTAPSLPNIEPSTLPASSQQSTVPAAPIIADSIVGDASSAQSTTSTHTDIWYSNSHQSTLPFGVQIDVDQAIPELEEQPRDLMGAAEDWLTSPRVQIRVQRYERQAEQEEKRMLYAAALQEILEHDCHQAGGKTAKAVFEHFGYIIRGPRPDVLRAYYDDASPYKDGAVDKGFQLEDPWVWAWMTLFYFANLRELDLRTFHCDFLSHWLLASWDGDSIASAPSCLSKLRSVSFTASPSTYLHCVINCVALFDAFPDLPQIQELSLDGTLVMICYPRVPNEDCALDGALNSNAVRDRKSPVEGMILRNCCLQGNLDILFRQTPRLKRVDFSLSGATDLNDERLCCLPEFPAAFALLKDTLEELSLTSDGSFWEPFGFFDNLREFRKLRRLAIDWQFFTLPLTVQVPNTARSSDYLPDELERLEIHTYVDDDWVEYDREYYAEPFVLDDYKRELHAHLVPTYRLAPYEATMTSTFEEDVRTAWYQRAVPTEEGASSEHPLDYI
ncbi:hypothetical protein BJ508DRAFT_89683 [Ascobolus immersus RN42]|uniref:Uncharacterized protein n=1 Tax=Ascobolus immersus RN42 TaxID=1160509 RepID=A0A3N4HAM1_ASCIM|nr:hypothetical protein BJ508DRAFT_89683 [Ascobolus immersus RN42]